MMTNSNTVSKDPIPPLIKVSDAAKLFSVSRATVHAMIQSGDLEAKNVSPSSKKKREHVRIIRESLCAFYKKRFGQPLERALENPFKN